MLNVVREVAILEMVPVLMAAGFYVGHVAGMALGFVVGMCIVWQSLVDGRLF